MTVLLIALCVGLLLLGSEGSDFEFADQKMQRSFHEANLALFTLKVKYPDDELAIRTARKFQREVTNKLVLAETKGASTNMKSKKELEKMRKEKQEEVFTFMQELRQAGQHLRELHRGDGGFEDAQTAVIHLYVQLETAEVLFEIIEKNLRSIEISGKGGVFQQSFAKFKDLKYEIGLSCGLIYLFILVILHVDAYYETKDVATATVDANVTIG